VSLLAPISLEIGVIVDPIPSLALKLDISNLGGLLVLKMLRGR